MKKKLISQRKDLTPEMLEAIKKALNDNESLQKLNTDFVTHHRKAAGIVVDEGLNIVAEVMYINPVYIILEELIDESIGNVKIEDIWGKKIEDGT